MNDSTAPKPRRPRLKLLDKELQIQQVDLRARRQAAIVLEVLAGLRTPQQAAAGLAISLPTYFNLETRALRGLVGACTFGSVGRQRSLAPQLRETQMKLALQEQQLQRYQALLRSAQRGIGLPPVSSSAPRAGGKGRHKKPAVRALRAIAALQQPDRAVPAIPAATGAEPVAVAG